MEQAARQPLEHELLLTGSVSSTNSPAVADNADTATASPATVTTAATADATAILDSTKTVHEVSLRANHHRALLGLDLPFYATNVERVLETVGGLAHLQQTHANKGQFLAVKLRPTEPSCKPLFADLAKTQSLVLRVRRKRKHARVSTQDSSIAAAPPPPPDSATTNANGIDVELVGLVREAYVCEGMADFQYFTSRQFYPDATAADAPTHTTAAAASTYPHDTTSTVLAGSSTQLALKASLRPYLNVSTTRELELIPEVFSKVDLPLKYEFRQRSGYQPTAASKKPTSTMTYLNFDDDTTAPAEPKPEHPIVRRRPVGAHDAVDDHVLRVLQDKLAHKPVWLRPQLFVGLDFLERRAARRLLRKLCYVFVDGPWRGSWIRMGYDPRMTSDAARYQVLELRNNRELVHAKVTHPSRKRTKKFSGINPKGPRIAKVTQTTENESAQASKRRRKERFLLSETRRAYLVDAAAVVSTGNNNEKTAQAPMATLLDPNDASDDVESNDNDSDRASGDDDRDDGDRTRAAAPTTASTTQLSTTTTSATTTNAKNERLYEIFGVPLTSANVLFQLEDIDDLEVRDWIAQFPLLDKPTLLGGWYSPHMFLPLREVIRHRIAALVGRSRVDLETRRKRIDALKKQALADYAEQLATGSTRVAKSNSVRATRTSTATATTLTATATVAIDETDVDMEQAAFEESLVLEHATSRVPNAAVAATAAPSTSQSDRATHTNGAKRGVDERTAAGDADDEETGDDDDLEFDEDDEVRDEEQDAAMFARTERLQRNGNDRGSDEGDDDEDEDDDDGEDEEDDDESDTDVAGRNDGKTTVATNGTAVSAAAETDVIVRNGLNVGIAVGANGDNNSSKVVDEDQAMEYSF